MSTAPLSRTRKVIYAAIAALMVYQLLRFAFPPIFERYTGVVNPVLTYENSIEISPSEFDAIAQEITYAMRLQSALKKTSDSSDEITRKLKLKMLMNTPSMLGNTPFRHIEIFRKAGIMRYEGPQTCLACHENTLKKTPDGGYVEVDILDDIVDSVHFKFQSTERVTSTYGFDGRHLNDAGVIPLPVGKINRACGIPGSFTWTGWAALIETKPAKHRESLELRSEGCGQCHIGGNYHPASEKMLPVADVPEQTKHGIDCLICHSQFYDMNQRFVIRDEHGTRWNQDRSMRAAMSVTMPSNFNCLLCHQHNLGGDTYPGNHAAQNLGLRNRRLLHHGAKRGTPFDRNEDVHATAGLLCTDCHVPEGHKIPRGIKGVDLVSNDIPGKEVSCENCHSQAPHNASKDHTILNGHVDRLACESCHIRQLSDDNIVLRDWIHPTWNEEDGIFEPTNLYSSGSVGKGYDFLWFNGNGTFLANALGDNPNDKGLYDPFNKQLVNLDHPDVVSTVRKKAAELKTLYPDIDVEKYVRDALTPLTQISPELLDKRRSQVEERLTPLMREGHSRIYPFKIFNALMYEDMANQGPFGGMILPFDYPTYYESGEPKAAVIAALQHPIMRRMYESLFKVYMMDDFMRYFGMEKWNTEFPLNSDGELNAEPRWMRQMGSLLLNHGIQRKGYECKDCHAENGIMDFEKLGYTSSRVEALRNLPELKTAVK